MKRVFFILGTISVCHATPILEWTENTLSSAMSGGSIAGYYNGIVYGLSPRSNNTKSSSYGTWKIDVNTGKSESYAFDYPTPQYIYKQSAANAFTTVGHYIYFLGNAGSKASSSSSSSGIGCKSSPTVLAAFNMKANGGKYYWKQWTSDHKSYDYIEFKDHRYRSYKVLPCVTSTVDGKYLIIMGGELNEEESSSEDDHDETSKEVIFMEADSPWNWFYGPSMKYSSSNFGCIAAHDGYLYKFGGSNTKDPAQGWKLDISNLDKLKDKEWEKIDIDLGVNNLQNPTVLELEEDKLLYIIGGYDAKSGSCLTTVTFLNITDDKNVHDQDYIAPKLIDGYCYGAGVVANRQFYLLGGSQFEKGTETADSEAVWQQTINSTISPTPSPTKSPTKEPTIDPTVRPSADPTESPTKEPTNVPTTDPTGKPTATPTDEPTADPTSKPSVSPSVDPTKIPTNVPTTDPTTKPTESPTAKPTVSPTDDPTIDPTTKPTGGPTKEPTTDPTSKPTGSPTKEPTSDPTSDPTSKPTAAPTKEPTVDPTNQPTIRPSASPTNVPTIEPTSNPTTDKPSASPTITAPKSSGDGSSTNWVVLFSLIGFAALLIVVACSVYGVKRYKARDRQQQALLQIM